MSKLNAIDEELRAINTNDEGSCSDFRSKLALISAVVGPERCSRLIQNNPQQLQINASDVNDFDEFDARIMEWLTTVPALIRWSLERRYGLWTGTMFADDADTIGEELGFSSTFVMSLVKEGLRILVKPENLGVLQLKE